MDIGCRQLLSPVHPPRVELGYNRTIIAVSHFASAVFVYHGQRVRPPRMRLPVITGTGTGAVPPHKHGQHFASRKRNQVANRIPAFVAAFC